MDIRKAPRSLNHSLVLAVLIVLTASYLAFMAWDALQIRPRFTADEIDLAPTDPPDAVEIELIPSDKQIAAEVDRLFDGFVQGKFPEPNGSYMGGGWTMPLPDGSLVDRGFLREASKPIISLGEEAVPCLLKWVRYENVAIRYLAVYSLERITGVKAKAGYFSDSSIKWEKEIGAWKAWWQKRRRA